MKYMNFFKTRAAKAGLFIMMTFIPQVSTLTAQNPNRERLEAYKIAFFTKRMNLTPQEAEKFWPLYNEYTQQRNQLQAEKQNIMRTVNQNEGTLSDKEMTDLSNKYLDILMKESSIAVDFHKKVMEVLPPAKVIRMYQAENQYRLQLLNELQQKRPLQPGNNLQQRNNQLPRQ